MRLMRLLSTGKSLVGMSNEDCAYHESDEVLLPRFERKQNPFRVTTLPAHVQSAVVVTPEESESVVQKPAPVQAVAAGKGGAAKRSAGPVWVSRLGRVPGMLRSLLRQLRERVFPARKAPQPAPDAAQAELRLDAVTVVRNDLSDTDIEIVPRTGGIPAVHGQAVNTLPAVSAEAVASATWSRASARVFGPEN